MRKTSLTQKLVMMAILIALEVILTRFLSIQLPIVRIGFGFLPVAVAGIMFGPVWAGAGYAIGDILGMLIFPTGPYFPGFTATAFVVGFLFGLFLHKKQLTLPRTIATVAVVITVGTIVMNTTWLTILYGNAFLAILPARLVEAGLMAAVQIVTIQLLWKKVLVRVPAIRRQTPAASLRPGLVKQTLDETI
jgi:ECF transporter S component (folate family)